MLRFLTGGESHGPQLTAIVSGFPAGVPVSAEMINRDLERRQGGYGRGSRMKIEKDKVEIVSGVRFGRTMGSPITLVIKNLDYENWRDVMNPAPGEEDRSRAVTRPRPGHADLPGCLKYGHTDARNILERSSARETAARVAVGALCKCLLQEFGIHAFSHVLRIGDVEADCAGFSFDKIQELVENSDVRCADKSAAEKMRRRIDEAAAKGDTLGGVVEAIATGVPVGLGNVMSWDEKLDGLLAQAVMSIQAVKGVEIGMGFGSAKVFGSAMHDAIYYSTQEVDVTQGHGASGGFYHRTNNAGGIEGGITNGEPVLVRAAVKPIPTMMTPKESVDLVTRQPFKAATERSDVCAVPAAAVIVESALAFILALAFLEKFGGDSLAEIQRNYQSYVEYLKQY